MYSLRLACEFFFSLFRFQEISENFEMDFCLIFPMISLPGPNFRNFKTSENPRKNPSKKPKLMKNDQKLKNHQKPFKNPFKKYKNFENAENPSKLRCQPQSWKLKSRISKFPGFFWKSLFGGLKPFVSVHFLKNPFSFD